MSNINSLCPICDGHNQLPSDTQTTEIVTCRECDNRLVVTAITNDQASLEEAPEIEEDWGQ